MEEGLKLKIWAMDPDLLRHSVTDEMELA